MPTSRTFLPRRRCLASLGAVLSSSLLPGLARAVPVWGAPHSSPVDLPPADLKAGQWIWGGDSGPASPMVVVVSLDEQRAYVYRNGLLEAVSTVSTGKRGHATPTGVFTILQKDRNHRSSLYNDAPMPYQERLTWDGIALHAGGLPGYPESHGCVHLPTEFARRLFETTTLGMTVVIGKAGVSPASVVHPTMLSPVTARGASDGTPGPLAPDESSRWTPEVAPAGPVSLVLSSRDERLVVLRGGVEIGRTRFRLRQPGAWTGTHAFTMETSASGGTEPRWIAVGVPGHESEAGQALGREAIDNVEIPPAFVAQVLPLLQPGSVLVATDAAILPQSTGPFLRVVDAQPPG